MALKPILMDDVDLIIGDIATGPNFKCQLTEVTLTPDAKVTTLRTLCPSGVYNAVGAASWNLNIGYANFAEDGEGAATTIPALAEFLFDNQGEKVTFWFRPRSNGRGWRGTVTVVPGPVGGSQGQFMKGSVTLPLDGQPVQLTAVVTP